MSVPAELGSEDVPAGPLAGVRVVEFAAIGPVPYAAMLLADMGADVLRIDRPGENAWPNPVMDRGRASLQLDLSTAAGRREAAEILAMTDVVIEGLRPGVMERLELGPAAMLARNPRLIYGRMTGWGQDGPLSRTAGHDITYLAMTGALSAIGRPGEPAVAPLNLLGDFGGGSLFLVCGIMLALWEREKSGRGQVIDAAILDGVTSMMSLFLGLLPQNNALLDRSENLLAGAAPYYRCYICEDGRQVAVGAIEPQFWRVLCERLQAPQTLSQARSEWADTAAWLEAKFATRSMAYWSRLFEGSDACVAPVLTVEEAWQHPHNAYRQSVIATDNLFQPRPAPRLTRSPGQIGKALNPDAMLARWRAVSIDGVA